MMSLFENKAHTEFLRTLNENQRDAVTAPLGPSLVLAGAGSGKTRVLTGRAVHLIRELHASPSSIAVMTFTNKAARELKERLTEYMEGSTDLPWAGTFHSFCVRILRQYGHIAGMSRDFTIYDEDDSQRVVNELLRERQIMREGITPRQIRSAISRIKNGSKMDHRTPVATIADEIYDEYRSRLSTANAYDFDDLLLIPLELMKQKDEFRELLQKKFDHLLIDEFQDTNQVQFDLACMIASPQNNVFAVGDDDQSIYSWRGANYRNVLDFGKKLENARIYRLEQNYRSTQPILDAANDVIAASTHRHEKTLWTKRKSGEKVTLRSFGRPADEANEIISLIDANRQKHGLSLKDFAILYRTNAISRYFEEVLVQHRIPYTVVGGLKFYERKEIKDFIAYLRVIANPTDEQAWSRIFREIAAGVGATTIERIMFAARSHPLHCAAVMDVNWLDGVVSGAPRAKVMEFVAKIALLREAVEGMTLSEIVDRAMKESCLEHFYENQDDDDARDRLDNLRQFQTGAWERSQQMPELTLTEFLTELALVSDIDDLEEVKDRLPLMTIHSAKGLEFPVVFVAGLEENLLPHSRSQDSTDALDEERRLLYVAMTRAKDKLFLSYAEARPMNGRLDFQTPSRFLSDIDPSKLRGAGVPAKTSSRYVMDEEYMNYERTEKPRATSVLRKPSLSRPAHTSSGVEYRIGDVVEHAEFGVGTITAKSGDMETLKVRVAFTGFGSKLLAVKYANLKKLS
jgi:DNA helicase-2/ATP-dependent DNA helicase PcrA